VDLWESISKKKIPIFYRKSYEFFFFFIGRGVVSAPKKKVLTVTVTVMSKPYYSKLTVQLAPPIAAPFFQGELSHSRTTFSLNYLFVIEVLGIRFIYIILLLKVCRDPTFLLLVVWDYYVFVIPACSFQNVQTKCLLHSMTLHFSLCS
jgi:hypothetical protein